MIEWNRVDELREEVGAEDFEEVVALFLSEVEKRLSDFDTTALATKIEEDMHFLKGSALNLGFSELAQFCGEGENQAASGQIMKGIDQVRQIYDDSKAAFLGALGGDSAA